MRRSLAVICILSALLLAAAMTVARVMTTGEDQPQSTPPPQSACPPETIEMPTVIGSQDFDVNGDGHLDRLVVREEPWLGEPSEYVRELQIELLMRQADGACFSVFTYRRKHGFDPAKAQTFPTEVRLIELVELTGDNNPEVHVWVDLMGVNPNNGDPYSSLHVILSDVAGEWKTVIDGANCYRNSRLEFRETAKPGVKDLYFEEDPSCYDRRVQLFGTTRDYWILRWNGDSFDQVEKGRRTLTEAEIMAALYPACLWFGACLISMLALLWLALALRKRHGRGE